MRSKEGLADYRYFPEPDLPEVIVSQEYIDATRAKLPELPEAKRRRYESLGLSMQDTLVLADDVDVSSIYRCNTSVRFKVETTTVDSHLWLRVDHDRHIVKIS